MLESLILAYRKELYDWSFKTALALFKKNKIFFCGLIIFILIGIATVICSLTNGASIPLLVLIAIEVLLLLVGDRLQVKRYRQIL